MTGTKLYEAGGSEHAVAVSFAGRTLAPDHQRGQRRLIRLRDIQAKTDTSLRTARKIIAEAWFPDPVELGPRVLRWVESEVDEALASRAPRRAELAPEPSQLTRGRAAKRQSAGSKGADQLVG